MHSPISVCANGGALDLNELEDYIREKMARWEIPGLSLAIVKDGAPVLVKGYGVREAGGDAPVDQHTLFPLSAGTRLFTASALAMLAGEEKLSWDDRLSDRLTWFKTGNGLVNNEATIRDALGWRIGVANELAACSANPGVSRREFLDRLQAVESLVGFREGKGISHLLTVAAGEIIPGVSGLSWDDFIRERLFKPIGMGDSITGPEHLTQGMNVASPHDRLEGAPAPIPHAITRNRGASISLYSSAADMARWLQFHLDHGKIGDEVLIPDGQISELRKIQQACPMPLPGYKAALGGHGLGLYVLVSHGGCQVYAAGSDNEGFESFYAIIPELNIGIACMVNAHYALPQRIIPWILDRYTGAPQRDWIDEGLELAAQGKIRRKQAQDEKKETLSQADSPPALPLSDYAGVYRHGFLGELTVRHEGDRLSFTLGEAWVGDLVHCSGNTFFREPIKPMFARSLFRGPLRFKLGFDGAVSSLTIEQGEFRRCDNAPT